MPADTQSLGVSARDATADRIASLAWSLEGYAEDLPGGPPIAKVAHFCADALTVTADYIREHTLTDVAADASSMVKRHPVPAMLGALAVGFLLARALRRQ